MGWFEIVLILLFFVLPLIQQVLAERKKPTLPPREADAEERAGAIERGAAYRPELDLPPAEPAPAPPAEPLDWTNAEWEAVAEEETVDEERAAGLSAWQEALPPEVAPEAARVSSPVVSLEPLRVDRRAEHDRMHRRHEQTAIPSRRPSRSRLARLVQGEDDLRRAILLAEVVGKPRGLE